MRFVGATCDRPHSSNDSCCNCRFIIFDMDTAQSRPYSLDRVGAASVRTPHSPVYLNSRRISSRIRELFIGQAVSRLPLPFRLGAYRRR
ncbi:MAG: hypothetical protein MJ062_08405 [Oscillospiraceae bacterium]|nr:hypothetical protein [Oscillospiraceae bacterium]